MRRLILAVLLLSASRGEAQLPATADSAPRTTQMLRPATDSLFRRARRMVTEGNGTAGRALVDSLLRAADPATPAYGDALYWHGALAPTAAEAEGDYRRVIVEYPLAYYADDALLAIAELEQARGDRAGALTHLQRFVKEHPSSPGRGVAALGAARLAFEQRDTKLGCSMIGVARTSSVASDVELRNQIDYYGRQCTDAALAGAASPSAPQPVAPVATRQTSAATAPATSTTPGPAPVSTMPSPVTPARRAPMTTTPTPMPTRQTVSRRDSPPRAPASVPTVPARASEAPGRMFTIQLAAYDTRPPAEQLVRKLATRGVKARVSGTAKPFRVRLDFYHTRQEASKVVAQLKARGIVGFVAEEVPPPGARMP